MRKLITHEFRKIQWHKGVSPRVNLPTAMLRALGLENGSTIIVKIEGNKITLEPVMILDE